MLSYCLKCEEIQRNTESKNSTVSKTANEKAMLLFLCKMQKLKIFQRIGG